MKEFGVSLNEQLPSYKTVPELPPIAQRPRRNRATAAIRALVQETHLLPHMLVAPLFIVDGQNQSQEIHSLPDIFRLSIDLLIREVEELYKQGIRAVDLFPVILPAQKDRFGSEAIKTGNLLERSIRAIKSTVPEMCVMVDVALDPFTSHGHDGLVDHQGKVLNDQTLTQLAHMSVLAADAGADIVAPSDMMDGRVSYIRAALDLAGHHDVGILSYAVKYASSLYGPFRDALKSGPKFGDKRTYQMDPANQREALREILLDQTEGADLLLIKPALPYLDIIAKAREITHLPIGAYHVSGEYAMVMAAAQRGWLDADKVLHECLLSIRRAGADFILTYAAKRMSRYLKV